MAFTSSDMIILKLKSFNFEDNSISNYFNLIDYSHINNMDTALHTFMANTIYQVSSQVCLYTLNQSQRKCVSDFTAWVTLSGYIT
uniref:Uncharacterized protein n=1 Tax=Octopus bimaculoides TaxID=37653 RepID=A0A0L8IIM2_OCTBM